jgi:hypothetical protein
MGCREYLDIKAARNLEDESPQVWLNSIVKTILELVNEQYFVFNID